MKKYLISTLTAAAAMAVPAFSAELIGSWDFSQTATEETGVTSIQSSVAYDNDKYLTISTGGDSGSTIKTSSSSTTGNGYLDIYPAADAETVIDVSGASLTTTEGVSIVMTIDNWGSSSEGSILASFETNNGTTHSDAAAIGLGSSGSDRTGFFAANGTVNNVTTTVGGTVSVNFTTDNPLTVTLTFVGDLLSIYQDGELVCQATINSGTYSTISGSITEIGIGSWEDSLSRDFSELRLISMEIYRGDIMAAPEPSMFGLMFGLCAIGLVATRRRKRA